MSSNKQQNLNGSKISNDSVEAEDSEINIDFDEPEKLEEIQNIKFPDKVIMKQSTLCKQQTSELPRLDMSRVYEKYQSQSNTHLIKPNKKTSQSQTKISLGHTKKVLLKNSIISQKSIKLDNLKNELVKTREQIIKLENSVAEAQKTFKANNVKHSNIKENLRIADEKIEYLRKQLRNYTKKDINYDVFY